MARQTSLQHRILTAQSSAGSLLVLLTLLSFCPISTAQEQSHPVASKAQRPSKTAETFPQIEALVRQGRLDEAKAQMLEELQKDPASVERYNLLGIIESGQQDYSNALAAFQKALQLAPNSTKTHVNLGNVYVIQKRIDLAEKEFRTVLRLDPRNQDASYNLAVLLMAKGSSAQAISLLENIHPANIATRFKLIQACLQTKRTVEALRMATELSAQNKNDVQVHFSLGLLLASEKQLKPAQLELQQADVLKPGTFEILYNLGHAYLLDGENPKAQLALSEAIKLKPESPETLYLLAQIYVNETRPWDALDLLVRAHKMAPENVDVIYLMAQVSMSQKYFEDAIPLLESGIKIAPQRTDLIAVLGESYFMSGKVEKAIDEFKTLVDVEHSARAYAFLGICYQHLGRFDEAKQYFEKGLKIDSHSSSCLFNLGLVAEQQGDSAFAEARFEEVLRSNPDYPNALLELANLRMESGKYAEAETLLKRYVRVGRNPATGYYKLSRVEARLHETAAADRDRNIFQTLSKGDTSNTHYYENLFDYLDNRAQLAPLARDQQDLAELINQVQMHPDQPEALYLLTGAYLKAGKVDEARSTLEHLDKVSSNDYRTLTGTGVLFARYHMYDDAIQHFQKALQVNPASDEIKFDLANAYFRKGLYAQALDTAGQVSEESRKDDANLALLGDIYAHLGDTVRAKEIFRNAISRNPDNDQDYLALSLLEFRENNIAGAKQTLLQGQTRVPASGKILWGLGIASVLEGKTAEAAAHFERAVDVLPEWPGSYSILGVFYFQTGQIDKAKEVLNRFKNNNTSGGLDVNKIGQILERAPATAQAANEPMTMASRAQLLQLALSLADRTL